METQARFSIKRLIRRESVAGPMGIGLMAIMVVALGASAAWAVLTSVRQTRAAHLRQTLVAGELVAETVEMILTRGDLPAARRLVLDAGRMLNLERCSVVLPDGGIVADADPNRINVNELDDSWSGQVALAAGGASSATIPIQIGARGQAALVIDVAPVDTSGSAWRIGAGMGFVSLIALLSSGTIYRRNRRNLGAVGAVREALLALGEGESDQQALLVSEAFGPEARAWNGMVRQRDRLVRQQEDASITGVESADKPEDTHLAWACDALRQGLMLMDENLQVRYANGASARLLGVSREQMSGVNALTLIEDDGARELVRSVTGGGVHRWRSVKVDRGSASQRAVLRFSVRPLGQGDGDGLVLVIEDVTQARIAEEARHAFVAQATHELRTPLTNIRLYVDEALEAEGDPTERARALNVINQESARLERIVSDLLSVSEIEAGSLGLREGDVRIDAVLADLEADYIAQAADKSIELEFDLPPKLPMIRGDREKIVVVLQNLVGNAIKYTPSGGKVRVIVSDEGGMLRVEVSDTGLGIDEQDQDRVFEQFYRADDRRIKDIKGSGLGLALARDIARLHGGDITVRSQVDVGSTFTVTLPALAEAA